MQDLKEQINELPTFSLVELYSKTKKIDSVSRFVGVRNDADNEVVACVSRRYSLVQMKDVFNSIASAAGDDVIGTVRVTRGKGRMSIRAADVGLQAMNSVDRSSA